MALGHSGLTGYDSDPQQPQSDVLDNSWATGTNPKVDSIYQRIVALNPEAKGHVANFAVDGSGVDSLPYQETEAAAVTPTPQLVIIQSIDNDIKCDGTDPQNYGPYRRKLTAVMNSITQDLPGAKIFFVSQWASVKDYDRTVKRIDPDHITGTGLCDPIDLQTRKPEPQHEAYLQSLVDHYFGIITAVCAKYPTCRTDHGAMQEMKLQKGDLAAGLDHLSVTGHRKMAALAWRAFYG
ncbi:MAG TPA: SGNH/GDSL hydrolase family protein [Nocardioides sp.]|uniref:SGNH/GDSL hydrolase family protein n=1 Tax=Nocardioides sp. TaxID=35761 RepID=UPI002E3753A3|nr:SGNH/GDSL hydrolase family protein [Nocardioides sp.]HEX3930116.1 SGNH/GDSL hydrolase family protein [Nocardioides sp.]